MTRPRAAEGEAPAGRQRRAWDTNASRYDRQMPRVKLAGFEIVATIERIHAHKPAAR